MGQKRGQITVYIIIGIIALVSVSVFLYMRSVKVEAPATYRPTIEEVPVIAEPIRSYVASCVRQIAEEGLRKVGDYGGYTSKGAMQAALNPLNPTEADAVQFSPDSDLAIPYWWYMKSPNDCQSCEFSTKRPNLLRSQGGINIEEQLDDYVNENLRACLRDFVDLQAQAFEISEAGDVETKTVVTQESVAFHVKYPLVARKGGETFTINEYFVDIPIRLKKMYDVASTVVEMQANYSSLEKYIKNTIALFSRLDENALPPFSATGFDTGGGIVWIKPEVEQRVKSILMAYIPMLRVMNTRNAGVIMFPEGMENRNALVTIHNNAAVLPLDENSGKGLEVYFSYLDWWKPYFDITPCDGAVCKADTASAMGLVSYFIQKYNFNYDISMPVLVNIVDPKAFNLQGYTFKFFMEANLRNNDPAAENMTPGFEAVSIPAGSMLCDENKRNIKNVTVLVTSGLTGRGVANATIGFRCAGEQCVMGDTNEEGKLVADFPSCAGGIIQVEKQGYHGSSEIVHTDRDSMRVGVSIEPYRFKDFKVMKYKLQKSLVDGTWSLRTTPVSLGNKEEAVVTLIRHEGAAEAPFSTIVEYTGDRSLEDYSKDVMIIPGNYDIEIAVINRDTIEIPDDERCYESGFFGEEDCFTVDGIEFNEKKPYYAGGLELEGDNAMRISAVDLDQKDVVVLYAITAALEDVPLASRVIEDIQQSSKIPEYSIAYKNLVQPTYEYRARAAGREARAETLG